MLRQSTLMLLSAAALWAGAYRLPDGREFPNWEKPLQFSKTYYVDGNAANASDNGPGTKEQPFRTVGKAADVLQPGERVVIAEGVYRECVRPARGGTGPEKMISYEAAPGAKVYIRASAVLKDGWKPSTGFMMGGRRGDSGPEPAAQPRIWEYRLDPKLFADDGYNPFAMVNVIQDRYWLNYGRHRHGALLPAARHGLRGRKAARTGRAVQPPDHALHAVVELLQRGEVDAAVR